MRPLSRLVLAAVLILPSAAFAAPASPLPSEIRLSGEEKESVLEAAATANRAPPTAAQADPVEEVGEPAQPIHGEVGFTIGSGGYRSAYGTAVVPLQDSGVAIISLGTTDFGRQRFVEPWWR